MYTVPLISSFNQLMCRHVYGRGIVPEALLPGATRRQIMPTFLRQPETVIPVGAPHCTPSTTRDTLELPSKESFTPPLSLKTPNVRRQGIRDSVKSIIVETFLLLWKGKQFKGCFIPSKWKWYHRHGYWATRKKLLKFDTYRRHRYHEVRGPGRRPPSKWEDQSFFKPLKDSVRFW